MLATSISVVGQLRGDSYASAQRTKSAKFYYVYDGVPGFVDKGEDGVVRGFLVDIMKQFETYVREKKGISVRTEFIQVPNKDFTIFMSQVKEGTGGVFGLSNVSIREDRLADYSFSPAYMNNVSVLITNSKTPTLPGLAEISTRFAGKKAYSVSSSSYYDRLSGIKEQYFPSLEIVSLPSVDEVLKEVSRNNDAFAVIDLHYYIQSLKTNPIKRHSVGDRGQDKFGVIMPKVSDWEPIIKEFFNSGFIGGPEYRKLIGEHLGKGALRLIEGVN